MILDSFPYREISAKKDLYDRVLKAAVIKVSLFKVCADFYKIGMVRHTTEHPQATPLYEKMFAFS